MRPEGVGSRESGVGAGPPVPDRFLVYGEDGGLLVYSGSDPRGYQSARRALESTHDGALAGQSMMGRERWLIVTYYHHRPDDTAIRRRREGGLLGLVWEPSAPGR